MLILAITNFLNNLTHTNMSRIKEFYHEEICAMQENTLEAEYQEFLNEEQEAVKIQIAEFEREKAEVEASDMPRYFHSKF